MKPHLTRHEFLLLLLTAATGLLWAWLGSLLSHDTFGALSKAAIPAGLLIGPAIYLVSRRFYRGSTPTLFVLSIVTTILAVAFFGLAVGILDALRDIPGRNRVEVVLQAAFGFLWGLFLIPICWGLFPLALATHTLFRHLEHRTRTTT